MRRGAGDGVKPDTASAAMQTPGMGAGKLYMTHAAEKLFQPFFWSCELAFKWQHSSLLLDQRPDSSWFFPYSRARVTSGFTGSKCSFEKAKFSKQPISKASESLCTCLPGVIAKCSINRSFWGVSDLFLPCITPSCPAAHARQSRGGKLRQSSSKAAVGGCKDPTE